jgi:hypothetical protein
MNKLKKLYRDFFGLTEQSTPTSKHPVVPGLDPKDTVNLANYNKELQKTQALMKGMTSEEIDEAQLVNNITDYRGGVEYVLRDPAEAKAVAQEIREWAERKGFTVVKHTISPTGKVGYFYFRLGQDPARESQRIQGYIAQKPEIKHFRFNVRGEKKMPQRTTPQAPENI